MEGSSDMQPPRWDPLPAATQPEFSYLFPIGYSNSSDCGYCRRPLSGQFQKRYSYYAIATSLQPAFYQKLVDRCWRRSGTLLYRPNQRNSCCPHYTLRLDSASFRPTKDQRQALNRFNRYILGPTYANTAARLHPRSREEARRRRNHFDLIERVHESEAKGLPATPVPAHEFVVTLEPDEYTEEKYLVFENYQRCVHREPPEKVSRHGFKRFLCNSPLRRGTLERGDDTAPRLLGSFHQCYRLDGKLVAIGVLDLLPDCVSAVYFLYHESIHALNPGKLGALREIALARELGYRWWYPGYYIHSCPKMKYKIDYRPQYVLDPETLEWDLLDDQILSLFDRMPYVSPSRWRAEAGTDTDGQRASVVPNGHAQAGSQYPGGTNGGDARAGGSDVVDTEENEEAFLLDSGMPGIPSLKEMEALNMDGILLRSDYTDSFFKAADLVVWEDESESISKFGCIKSRIAELVAAVGPDLMGEMCVDFRKRGR